VDIADRVLLVTAYCAPRVDSQTTPCLDVEELPEVGQE
jgi:hypothetical protein